MFHSLKMFQLVQLKVVMLIVIIIIIIRIYFGPHTHLVIHY